MHNLLGVPPETRQRPEGMDTMGAGCRIAETVSIFRSPGTHPERGVHLGEDVIIMDNVRLLTGDLEICPDADLRIGNQVIINVGCYISGEGGLVIEDGVIIGANAHVLSAGHDADGPDPWIRHNALTFGPIRLGSGAWIGAGACVLEGRQVGTGAVVGAGSVVTRDVPDYAIVVGNPARIIRYRKGQASSA